MCCFTRNVTVSNTNIFAREAGGDRQYLVYEMKITTREDAAMVLPLPVPKGTTEEVVTFIDLSKYPRFFNDMDELMKPPIPEGESETGSTGAFMAIGRKPLAVQVVGNFEASFVPSLVDFDRLDERFRLPPGSLEQLPVYRDYGFAVFKLKAGEQRVHPMAFSFPRADKSYLFFPTVHIHDGIMHERADFDHHLYAQTDGRPFLNPEASSESPTLAKTSVDIELAKGIVSGDHHVYRARLTGTLPNQDNRLIFA